MKNKFLIVSIFAGAFFVPAFCLGAIDYSRTPAGSNITSPVSINFSADSFDDLELVGNLPALSYWIYLDGGEENFFGDCHTSTDLSFTDIINVPTGEEILGVFIRGFTEENCTGLTSDRDEGLEGDGGSVIFRISSIPVVGGIITLPGNALSSTTEYTGEVMESIGAFLWLAIGVPLAFYVIAKWLKTLP